ncbi:MAG TPA: hypothetical protein VK871_12260, partial [Candidatus Limnocylindrales bacterium]|nr:hypothetical protein [Candidatus Limnocylindrales bacterium]
RFRWESPLPAVAGGSPEGGRIVGVENPLSHEHSVLRPSVVGSLVETVSRNLRFGTTDVAIFEIGKGYGVEIAIGGGDAAPETREWWRLAIALTGHRRPASWNQPAEPYEIDDAKGAIELVCRRLGFDPPTFEPLRGEPLLHPGRAATVRASREGLLVLAGTVGELHPALDDEWELRGARVVVAELDIGGLGGASAPNVIAAPPPRHPASERDLAIVVSEEQAAGAVAASINRHGGPELTSLELFDVYRGAPLGATEKSLAFRLTFRAPDRTLEEAEVDAAIAAITKALATEVGGRIRT